MLKRSTRAGLSASGNYSDKRAANDADARYLGFLVTPHERRNNLLLACGTGAATGLAHAHRRRLPPARSDDGRSALAPERGGDLRHWCEQGLSFLVMELLLGPTVAQLIETRLLDIDAPIRPGLALFVQRATHVDFFGSVDSAWQPRLGLQPPRS